MGKKMPSLLPAGLVVLLVTLTGCAKSQHNANEKYVLIATNTRVTYWQNALAGLSKAGAQMDVKTALAGPETYNPQAQHDEFQKTLREKPTGILISAGNSKLMQPDIDQAIAQGIPVITIDSDVENSKRLFFIGTDNYKAGTIGSQVVIKQLQGKGRIVVFTMPTQPNLYQRLHGYEDGFAATPGIKVVQIVDIKGDSRVAFDTTKEILDKGIDKVDAFVCLEAIACPEVAEVLDRGHVQNKLVVAMDTDPRTLNWIQRGLITATIGQKPFTMAYFGVKMLDDIHHHPIGTLDKRWGQESFSPIPAFIDTGATLIDKSNVDSYLKAKETETQR